MSGSLDVLAVEQEYTISYMEAECEQLEEERLHADKELKEQTVKTADLKATVDEMITKAKRLSYLKQKRECSGGGVAATGDEPNAAVAPSIRPAKRNQLTSVAVAALCLCSEALHGDVLHTGGSFCRDGPCVWLATCHASLHCPVPMGECHRLYHQTHSSWCVKRAGCRSWGAVDVHAMHRAAVVSTDKDNASCNAG